MKLNFTFLFLLLATGLYAQVTMPATTLAEWPGLLAMGKRYEALKAEDYMQYPVYKLRGGLYLSLMGKTKSAPAWEELTALGVIRGSVIGNIASVKVPLAALNDIDFSAVFTYLQLPAKASADLNHVRIDVHADSVQNGLNLPQAYTGHDVLIGITDWGFDYTHPMFYDTLLTETRIVAAWDQFKLSGNQPDEFAYGVEYNTIPELLDAHSDTSNFYGFATHGSHVAGIAGGSGGGLSYRGIAPGAGFLFTTFLLDEASAMDAFVWMKSKADAEDKRLVINMSWGLYYMGTLDGNSLISQVMDALSEEGVVFVSSAGNNGDVNFHIQKIFTNDLLTSRIQFYPYASNPSMWGESISAWGEVDHAFSTGFSVHSASNVLLGSTPLYNTATALTYLDSMLVIGSDTVFFNVTSEAVNPLNGRPHMRLRIKNTNTALKIVLNATAVDGIVHFWNLVELSNGAGNWGLPLVSYGGDSGMNGDPKYSIGEPTCAASAITVGAYSAAYIVGIGTPVGGEIAPFTSVGPLITEVLKPDISGPGVSVCSSISSYTDNAYTQVATTNFNGRDYDFARFSGTSMSSPCVAGVVALVLEANPILSPAEVKEILKNTARLDEFTGIINAPGDTHWGRGKVNAYQAVLQALATTVDEVEARSAGVIVMPNPANDYINILLYNEKNPVSVDAISLDGKIVSLIISKGRADCSVLAPGVYVLRVNDGQQTFQARIIRN